MKIVLDTNVLLVALPKYSPFFPIYNAFLTAQFILCISNEILTEYEEQIGFRYGKELTELKLSEISRMRNVQKLEAYYHWQLIEQDPNDNKFVDCAIAANADYLVTNDKHFNILKTIAFPRVSILTAQEWLEMIKAI